MAYQRADKKVVTTVSIGLHGKYLDDTDVTHRIGRRLEEGGNPLHTSISREVAEIDIKGKKCFAAIVEISVNDEREREYKSPHTF